MKREDEIRVLELIHQEINSSVEFANSVARSKLEAEEASQRAEVRAEEKRRKERKLEILHLLADSKAPVAQWVEQAKRLEEYLG